jgi:hypothetical protein
VAGRARLAASLAGVLLLVLGGGCGEEEAPPPGRPAQGDLRFEGVWVEKGTSDPGGVRIRMAVASVVSQSRRIGVISIRPLKEVLAADMRVDVQLPGEVGPELADEPLRSLALPGRLLGFPALTAVSGLVVRLTSEPFEVQIADATGPLFRVRARRAGVRWRESHIDLFDARVDSRSGQRLEAPAARWLDDPASLAVAAGWTLYAERDTREGAEPAGFLFERSGRLEPTAAPPAQQR